MADDAHRASVAAAPPRGRLVAVLFTLLGAGLFVWLGRGSLGAGLVSEDSGVLGFVHEHGPFADWGSGQYHLRIVRFWRPLVTTSIGLQERWFGVDPAPLRLLNWGCHLASIALAVALAARLGAAQLGLAIAAVWMASFPYQGGTATWIVGRVDSQCLPFLLLAAWAGASGRSLLGALACVGAATTKEIGFAAPIWFWLAALGARRPRAVRSSLVPVAVTAALFVWRRVAIGDWVGGYPQTGPRPAPGEFLGAVVELAGLGGPTLPILLGAVILSAFVARDRVRPALLLAVAAAVAACAVLPLVASQGIAPEHRRWWLIPDAALGLALAVAIPPACRFRSRAAGGAALLATTGLLVFVVLHRAPAARADVEEWTLAGRLCDEHVERVREALADRSPSDLPVLDARVQRTTPSGRAYVFHWGFAERFLPPFEPTPRPVWPWRRIFEQAGEVRTVTTRPQGGLRWPFGFTDSTVYPMPVRLYDGEREVEGFRLDTSLVGRRDPLAPRVLLFGEYPGQRLEFVLHTELGHEVGVWTGPTEPAPTPFEGGGELPALALPLLSILESAEGTSLALTVRQVADLGATRAYLEIRGVDDARGIAHRPVSASRWIPIEWDAAFSDALLADL